MSQQPTGEKISGGRPAGEGLAAREGTGGMGVLGVVVFFHEVRELGEAQGCDCFGAAVAVLLRLLREHRGWTEAVAEERSGVRRQSIHNWEIGSQLPRMDRMGPLCQELGVQGWELHRAAAEIAGRMMQL